MSNAIQFAPVRKTIQVKAGQQRAFEVFATSTWWPKSHSVLASRSPQKLVTIEPRVGGRWFERGEDGSECDWGKVLAWDPPARMLLSWSINGRFQYDPSVNTEVEVKFIAEGANQTRVELEHRHFERAGETAEALRTGVDSGWPGILQLYADLVHAA
jgi:uncharacterized protein YndB with AHSA1/START domain